VSLRTLRFYEDRGLLQPHRVGSSRIYDSRDRERLTLILKGKQLGFTLVEIRDMLAQGEQPFASTSELKLSLKQVEDQIAHLENQKREIDAALAELESQRRDLRP
jgi:DNA-binding transcriptional MerR regulator